MRLVGASCLLLVPFEELNIRKYDIKIVVGKFSRRLSWDFNFLKCFKVIDLQLAIVRLKFSINYFRFSFPVIRKKNLIAI